MYCVATLPNVIAAAAGRIERNGGSNLNDSWTEATR